MTPGRLFASTSSQRIAMFVPALVAGGAEQVMLTLARGFVQRGRTVDLIVVQATGALLRRVPAGVRLVELGTRRTALSVPALARYVRRERPAVMLSTLSRANAVTVLAVRLAQHPTMVVVRHATQLSKSLATRPKVRAMLEHLLIRWSYWRADRVIAVSQGVADDLIARLRLPRARVDVVPNPILTAEFVRQARCPLDHAWFVPDAPPVVLAAGRLTRVKRFDLLIRAFARARQARNARLMILGEGPERARLEALVHELGLAAVVSLPGYVDNPIAYMARAAVFVLSSDYEGLPGVLIQAVACGTPVVATDCDSGPREILRAGRLGRLVPVGDAAALAEAIAVTLRQPLRPLPGDGCLPYTEAAAVDTYLRILSGCRDG